MGFLLRTVTLYDYAAFPEYIIFMMHSFNKKYL